MSDSVETTTAPRGVRSLLATRWQIPLFLAAGGLLAWGLWRMRPEPPKITFDQKFDHVVALQKARLYTEANEAGALLLMEPDRTPEESRKLHRLLADVIHGFERSRVSHVPANLQRMITHYQHSVATPDDLDGETQQRIARAWDWLERPSEAAEAYERVLQKGYGDSVDLQRRILDLKLQAGLLPESDVAGVLDAFIRAAVQDEKHARSVVWAADRRVGRYIDEDKIQEAAAFLESLTPAIGPAVPEADRNLFEYLQCLVQYRLGRLEDAERRLRALRDRMTVRNDVDAASAWLLGRLSQLHSAPQVALELYEGVLRAHFKGPYVAACRIGRADVLSLLERYDEDHLQAYRDVVGLLSETIKPSKKGGTSGAMLADRTWDEFCRFVGLAPSDRVRQLSIYTERLADLLATMAQRELRGADSLRDVASVSAPTEEAALIAKRAKRIHARLVEAGETYLRLSQQVSSREAESAAAMLKATQVFDLAGERNRTMKLLEAYVKPRTPRPRMADALLRLGQTYQAAGRYGDAVVAYQRVISDYSRTPQAIASMVPLADCFVAMGPTRMRDAERVLLSVLEELPDRPAVITPDAVVFRDSLFRIADLYMEMQDYDKAIVRTEEARARYPSDPRMDRARFRLAEAYRLGAAKIPAVLRDPNHEPQREYWIAEYQSRLARARELYDEVVVKDEARGPDVPRADLEAMCVRLSYFYRADCAFDAQEFINPPSAAGFDEAIRLYKAAVCAYQKDPMALSAFVQVINAYLRQGGIAQARATLEQARWVLNGIPEHSSAWQLTALDKKYWTDYLQRLGASPMLRSAEN